MGLGIKTTAKKIIHALYYRSFMYGKLTSNFFPRSGHSKFEINSRLRSALLEEKKNSNTNRIGTLIAKADPYAINIYQRFLSVNPNNIGSWSDKMPYGGAKLLEYELIKKLVDLYHGQKENLEGYFTSGGQEGNLYSIWLAKSFVTRNYDLKNVILLKTQLTHHSIDKACLISSLKWKDIPIDSKTWSMDQESLEDEIISQINKGMGGFIISLTIGYPQTGTSDNVQTINFVIQKLKREYKNIAFSIIIDAAFNGLIEPFVNNNFKPFESPDVHAFCIDFSKFTAVPYPAGAVLYRKSLREIIEREVKVAPLPDNTLLGSRSGAPVAAVWGIIHYYGANGFKKIINDQIDLKKYFLREILKIFPKAQIIDDLKSLSCGVVLDKEKDRLILSEIEQKFWLYAQKEKITFSDGKTSEFRMYKFYFLPYITKKSVNELILAIKNF